MVDEGVSKDISAVIDRAFMGGVTVQSDFARANASILAMAASMGLITTKTSEGDFGRTWRATCDGLLWLETENR